MPHRENIKRVGRQVRSHKLQISWVPQYSAPEGTSYEQQVVETVPAARVLGVVELSTKGVLNHASSSRLARQGWRVDEASVQRGGLVAPVGVPPALAHQPTSRMRALVAACSHEAELRLSERSPPLPIVRSAPSRRDAWRAPVRSVVAAR